MNETIQIREGLPYPLRWRAAELFYDAFRQKAQALLGSKAHAVSILARDIESDQAIVALRGGDLAGLAGIQHNRKPFLNVHFSTLVDEYSLFPALYRGFIASFYRRPYRPGELVMDGIAVDERLRGQGVGTRLLQAVIEFAAKHDYHTVRLDVVDTNPKARALYEKMGFVATVTHRYPFTRRWMGFSASTTMIRRIA